MKDKDIDTTLLTILLAICSNKYYVHNLRYLLNADVLTNEEEGLCNTILQQIGNYGHTDIPGALTELHYKLDDIETCEKLNYAGMYTLIDKLIQERRELENQELIKEALSDSASQLFTGKMLDTFFNRYVNDITVEDNTDYEDLKTPDLIKPQQVISTANEYIDSLVDGLEVGSLTTIVGTYDNSKSMWALNIAYKCLKENKNVLYLSLGTRRIDVYKRFLSRHSCDSKFDKPISVEQLETKYDKGIYDKVYNDFESFFLDHLIVYDDIEFVVNSHYNLQKLIVYAQKEFLDKTEAGIDVIILDDFSNMKLDNGKRSVTNKSTIINEYYKYLKNQAGDLLGTGKEINVIFTTHAINNFDYFFTNSYDFTLEFVNDEVKILSDYILTIYEDDNLRKNDHAKIKLLKSYKGTMESSKSETMDYEHWHLKYACDNNDDEAYKDTVIGTLNDENKQLKKTITDNNQTIQDLMQPPEKIDAENLLTRLGL